MGTWLKITSKILLVVSKQLKLLDTINCKLNTPTESKVMVSGF